MAQTHLLFLDVSQYGELLVDELGRQYGVSVLVCIVCGQVVVLAGVEDDIGITDDNSGEVLVDQCSLHVDISEQDPVDSVIEHDVQTLDRTHGCDLRHTHSGGIVAQTDVSADFFADLIQRFSHDPEVFLCCVGSAESLGRRSVRYVVQQRLGRRSDDRDDVSALTGSRLCLHHVFVDVSCRYDDVQIRTLAFSDGCQILVSLLRLLADLLQSIMNDRHDLFFSFFHRSHFQLGDVQLTSADSFCDLLRVLARLDHRVAHPVGDAARQASGLQQLIHNYVRQRFIELVDTVNAQQTEHCSLRTDRGVSVDEFLHALRDLMSAGTCVIHLCRIQVQFTFHPCSPLLQTVLHLII